MLAAVIDTYSRLIHALSISTLEITLMPCWFASSAREIYLQLLLDNSRTRENLEHAEKAQSNGTVPLPDA